MSSLHPADHYCISNSGHSEITNVDIALFNGFALPGIAAITEIFQKANVLISSRELGRSRYHVSLLSAAGGRIASSSSVFVWTDSIDAHRSTNGAHLLFIAGGTGAEQACKDERLRAWLRLRHPFSEMVYPVAEGRLLLEAAGLPSRNCQPLQAVQERGHMRSQQRADEAPGSLVAALRIVEGDLGPDLAQLVAESVSPKDQTPFSTSITGRMTLHVSEKILASARWLEANFGQSISIDDAAQIAAMSERTFLRRFKSEIGMTPSDYLLRARLHMSCRMLVESRLPIDKVARRCGIGSGGQLAKLFRKYLATTPTDYRMGKNASNISTQISVQAKRISNFEP